MRAAALAAVLATAAADAGAADGWRRLERSYATEADDRRRLDVYVDPAAGERARPVVVYLHGGGWYGGDRRRVHGLADWLVGEGVVLVSAGYRLVPEGAHPAAVSDVAAAVGWVHREIDRLGGDPERIVLMGHSAGAHLAALAATDPRWLADHDLSPRRLAGVIAVDTDAYDLVLRIRSLKPAERMLYLAAFGDDPAGWRAASPIAHVGPATPPFLIVDSDGGARRQWQSERFRERLEAAGVAVDHRVFRGESHGSIVARMGESGHQPSAAVLGFLRRVAGMGGERESVTDRSSSPRRR